MPTYRPATPADLEALWNWNIAHDPTEPRWRTWKTEHIAYNQAGMAATFAVIIDAEPVGEGTLLFSPLCSAVGGRLALADGRTTANVNALRIRKEWEGRGHISRLMCVMEEHAREKGMRTLTIGVEARETRNLAIYLHLGYTRLLFAQEEEGELVLYFAKEIG